MQVALCAIAKKENNYIREWVEHYQAIGFDKIFLYDNNDVDGERFDEVIGDYIASKFVEVQDYRGRRMCQHSAYNDCYKRFGNNYDWIAFLDIDEFLEIDQYPFQGNVKNFLDQPCFGPYTAVKVCWKCMTDSGILSPRGDYSVKKFTEALPITSKYNNYAKCIVRTGRRLIYKNSVHFPDGIPHSICDVLGRKAIARNKFATPIWSKAVILHYRFKTIEEYVLNKMQRLYPDHDDKAARNILTLDYFFEHNTWTPEKEAYAKELLKHQQ